MTDSPIHDRSAADNALMLSNIFRAARRWWWLLLLATMVAAGAAYRSASHTPQYYRAGATVMVGRVNQQANPSADSFTLLDRLTSFYASVATRDPVLGAAAKAVSPPTTADAIAPHLQTRAITGTQFIEITYLDTDPMRAAVIANAIATELIKQSPTPDTLQNKEQVQFAQNQLADLQTKISTAQSQIQKLEDNISQSTSAAEIADASDQAKELQIQVDGWRANYTNLLQLTQPSDTNYLSIVEPAAIPSVPTGSSRTLTIGVGGILGFAVAFGGVLIIEYLDDTLRRPDDIPGQTRLRLLATIPRQRRDHPPAPAPFSALRNALLADTSTTPFRLLVASPRERTGATYTAVGLAQAFARAGRRVVLVDGNLRAPVLHTTYIVPQRPGLADVIANPAIARGALRLPNPPIPNLCIVPAGETAGADDVLAGPRLTAALDAILAETGADVLLIDGGALGESTSSARLLAHHVSRTILVVTARSRASAVRAITETLLTSGTRVSGVVFNRYVAGGAAQGRPRMGKLLRIPLQIMPAHWQRSGRSAPHGAIRPAGAFAAVRRTAPMRSAPPGEPADMVVED